MIGRKQMPDGHFFKRKKNILNKYLQGVMELVININDSVISFFARCQGRLVFTTQFLACICSGSVIDLILKALCSCPEETFIIPLCCYLSPLLVSDRFLFYWAQLTPLSLQNLTVTKKPHTVWRLCYVVAVATGDRQNLMTVIHNFMPLLS